MLILVIIANVVVYLIMAATVGDLSFDADTLVGWGGNLGELSLNGQPWRLVTAMYLHAGPMHILGNMVLLSITGMFLELRIGPVRSLAAYTVCGLAGSLLSATAHPDVVSVGASGAIAGLLGIMVAFYLSGRVPEIRGAWIAQTVGVNALYSLAPNVDWAAHAGGFMAGVLVAGGLLAAGLPRPLARSAGSSE